MRGAVNKNPENDKWEPLKVSFGFPFMLFYGTFSVFQMSCNS
ncbi:hypothetical protein HMPREF1218_1292 [Hoylesella pleuritidis F0068]|uniref:Uncharacterized protein n=1 Tax=Hoylesella pleuritidis F0068 TaxID=1081904 RepID=U2MLW6_9BACT|nr:hypothetical protein HMPREF1218_1292 [Hoylesella pleuritidis F0068]